MGMRRGDPRQLRLTCSRCGERSRRYETQSRDCACGGMLRRLGVYNDPAVRRAIALTIPRRNGRFARFP
jgi:ribosomal protein L37E